MHQALSQHLSLGLYIRALLRYLGAQLGNLPTIGYTFIPDLIANFGDDLHGMQHVERIINAPLYILEIHVVYSVGELRNNFFGDLVASGDSAGLNLFQDVSTKINQLLIPLRNT
jgi:hypothetical protein